MILYFHNDGILKFYILGSLYQLIYALILKILFYRISNIQFYST